MHRLARYVTRYPWSTLLIALAITGAMIGGAVKVTITTDIKSFFPQDDARVLTYNRIDEEFGGAETIMVAYRADHIFEPDHLESISNLTDALGSVRGVSSVLSLANASEMRLSDFGIEVAPLMERVPDTSAEAKSIGDRVMSDDFFRGMVISADGTTALVVVQLEHGADRAEVVREVQSIVGRIGNEDATIYMTGTPVLNEVLVSSMQSDLKRLIPLVLLILAAVLFAYFRTLRGVVLPFLTVGLSLVWTIGLMGHLGKHLSPLSAVMPVILISLGNAYGIYIITRHNEETRHTDRTSATERTLKYVGIAVVMAGTTTIAGFLSNAGSSITLMREFGLFTAFGILSALLVSVTVVPAILTLLPERTATRSSHAKVSVKRRSSFLDGLLHGLAKLSIHRAGLVAGLTVAIVVVAIFGTIRLTSDSNFFNFFDPKSEARQAYELVKDKFGGSETVEIAITADLKDPDLLHAMDEISNELATVSALTRPVSAVDVVRRIDGAIMGEDVGYIPDDAGHIAQYYLLAEMDENNLLSRFVNIDYTQGRIQARTSDTSPQGVSYITSHIQDSIDRHMPDGTEATVTGMVVLLDALSEMLVNSQVMSLLLSFLTVFLIVRLLLGSWEGSLLAVTVIGVVTLANFGLMGWLGIPLDIVTVLISSIGVGVGVDFSIHIYSRFQEESLRGKAEGGTSETSSSRWDEALRTAITSTGRAVATNAGGVIAGFIVLASSSFPPLRYFGVLVTFSMAMAAAGALSLLPAIISLRRRRVRG